MNQWQCPGYRVVRGIMQLCLAGRDHDGYHKYQMTKTEVRALAEKMATAALDQTLRNRSWVSDAACAGKWDLFFWEGNSINRRNAMAVDAVLKAKTLCARCPVRRDCLNLAIGINETHGTWGGSLPWERSGRTDVDDLLAEMTDQAVRLGLVEKERTVA